MKKILLTSLLLLGMLTAYSQMKNPLQQIPQKNEIHHLKGLKINPLLRSVPLAQPSFFTQTTSQYTTVPFQFVPTQQRGLQVITDQATGLPIMIAGSIDGLGGAFDKQSFAYLEALKEMLQLQAPQNEFEISKIETDELGQTHIRLQQIYKNIKVYGAEILLHAKNGQIDLLNGRYYPTPQLTNVNAGISQTAAMERALEDVKKITTVKQLSISEQRLIEGKQASAELVIYHPYRQPKEERLAWAVTLYPNILQRWAYFIDAKTGAIIHKFSQTCTFYPDNLKPETVNIKLKSAPLPPKTATATDLFNVSRTINTWQEGNSYYLIDASRAMYNAAASTFPDDPVGVIWTIDALNNSPENDDFQVDHVRSNNNTWNVKTSVSAHYNASKAYEYFYQTFNRNSINGSGGNIISLINVTEQDGSGLDNAFWNGAAMFYGNGNQAFISPLAKGLDVGGHEMSHGVIQNTANLEYQDESGAINESFADVFGAMIDRDDWKIGEDISNPAVFPSGALRDMSNPHNGRTTFGQNGYQPAQVSEQYHGTQDNGGVHINSGIPNRAYYLFATAIGKDKAEKVYYRALTTYLTRSSKFIDLRLAVLKAAADLYSNTEVNAATTAFNTVGIIGNTGSSKPKDLSQNPGNQFILYSNGNQTTLNIATTDGNDIGTNLVSVGALSKPSVTDDGSVFVYIDQNQRMKAGIIDWQQGTVNEQTLSNDTYWRNVAISKDGTKIAALTDNYDNLLYVYDFVSQTDATFELYNPTYTQGISTGNVDYADALEWDYAGEYVMYDALSTIRTLSDSIDFWDIGFIQVWNNAANRFSDGNISKLFSGLPENVSVGNPTFSKKSPYIIAFDYLEINQEVYSILGANTETGDVGVIYPNTDLGFPNYSVDDKQLIFDGFSAASNDPVVGIVTLASDKINAATDPPTAQILIDGDFSGARWGAWFANGTRQLTDNEEAKLFDQSLQIFPNPFTEKIYLRGASARQGSVKVEVFDELGKRVNSLTFNTPGEIWQESFNLRNLSVGTYVIRVSAGADSVSRKIVKIK